jgi:hypothetical protein
LMGRSQIIGHRVVLKSKRGGSKGPDSPKKITSRSNFAIAIAKHHVRLGTRPWNDSTALGWASVAKKVVK